MTDKKTGKDVVYPSDGGYCHGPSALRVAITDLDGSVTRLTIDRPTVTLPATVVSAFAATRSPAKSSAKGRAKLTGGHWITIGGKDDRFSWGAGELVADEDNAEDRKDAGKDEGPRDRKRSR